jgi:hypothetical protein
MVHDGGLDGCGFSERGVMAREDGLEGLENGWRMLGKKVMDDDDEQELLHIVSFALKSTHLPTFSPHDPSVSSPTFAFFH